jgi:hypothetical protein
MSISGRVFDVRRKPDGTAELWLEPGPRKDPVGQPCLIVLNPPPHIEAMVGSYLWGGDSTIMCKDKKIADRIGYTRIRMTR